MHTSWNCRRICTVHDAAGDGGCRRAPWVRRVSAADCADRGQLDPLADQSLSRDLEQGRRGLRQVGRRRIRDAGHRGQQREGHRRHQGDPRQDRRQLRHQRRPERQPGCAPDRRGLQGGRRLRRDPVEQARRPASLGLRPELRRPHLVQRRALRQGDGRGADQGDGRQGRHRGARRHQFERARRSSARRASTQALAANPDVKLLDFQVANWTADRGAREDQRLAHPVRRRDQRHLGGERRHGAGRASRRCAPTAAPARCR